MEVTIGKIPSNEFGLEHLHKVIKGIAAGWQNLPNEVKELVVWAGIDSPPDDPSTSPGVLHVHIKINFVIRIDGNAITTELPFSFLVTSSSDDTVELTAHRFKSEVNACLARICKSLKDKEHELSFLLPGLK